MPNLRHHLAPATFLLAAAVVTACSSSAGPSGRHVQLGANIALELGFADSVVLAVEMQAADGRSWQPCGYLALKSGVERVALTGPEGTTDLRVTLGVAGKLVDAKDGTMLADGSTTVVQSTHANPVEVRAARITTQLQIARGTIATVRLDGSTTKTVTRPFAK
ncbi:MAG: hypothetical protein JNK15_14965 [Planctomycetes bacterium]|nr:hypothetical protein [Planctomycetota bacterium]